MSKSPTYPTLYDECLQISISFLRKHEYLNPSQWKSGTITWSIGEGENKQVTAQINISVNTHSESPYLELNYNYRGKPVNYRVQLVSVPSNLRKGKIWFFICPDTGKRCRKLYFSGGRFLHREAFRGMYSRQTRSKRWLRFETFFAGDVVLTEMQKPYFKTEYNGKPTKRYIRLLKKAEQVRQILLTELFR